MIVGEDFSNQFEIAREDGILKAHGFRPYGLLADTVAPPLDDVDPVDLAVSGRTVRGFSLAESWQSLIDDRAPLDQSKLH